MRLSRSMPRSSTWRSPNALHSVPVPRRQRATHSMAVRRRERRVGGWASGGWPERQVTSDQFSSKVELRCYCINLKSRGAATATAAVRWSSFTVGPWPAPCPASRVWPRGRERVRSQWPERRAQRPVAVRADTPEGRRGRDARDPEPGADPGWPDPTRRPPPPAPRSRTQGGRPRTGDATRPDTTPARGAASTWASAASETEIHRPRQSPSASPRAPVTRPATARRRRAASGSRVHTPEHTSYAT